MFIYNPTHSYDAHFHSTKNRRGVGILISKKLSYTIEKQYKDDDENILGLLIKIDNERFRIFSIYGPNHDDRKFYNEIDNFLSQDREAATILGGDWNSTYSTAAVADNIDIRNMRNPPSSNRSARSATGGACPTPSEPSIPTLGTTPTSPVAAGTTGHA